MRSNSQHCRVIGFLSSRLRCCRALCRDYVSDAIFGSDRGWLLHQSCSVRKVSQLETVPDFKPVVNQRVRCADEPWVKASGTT